MNSIGNCSLLEKTFNVSKSDKELATFLSEVHEFKTGERDLDQWALALGVTDALLRPKSSSLDQIQQARAQ
jgi:hypothetical protein